MNRPLLIALEGTNDLDFLVRLSDRLRIELPQLPDLRQLQLDRRIMLVPVGGGNPSSWPDRFRPLGLPEFHLYDREQAPASAERFRAIERVNARSDCQGWLTSKRALENYLSPTAIALAGGGQLQFGDHDPVSLLLARQWFEQAHPSLAWDTLDRRAQRRISARAKRWLNQIAVAHMSVDLLAESDPAGEVLGWYQSIREMVLNAASTALA